MDANIVGGVGDGPKRDKVSRQHMMFVQNAKNERKIHYASDKEENSQEDGHDNDNTDEG
jgi:hypothetical protein